LFTIEDTKESGDDSSPAKREVGRGDVLASMLLMPACLLIAQVVTDLYEAPVNFTP
jgi:hypothetical protein